MKQMEQMTLAIVTSFENKEKKCTVHNMYGVLGITGDVLSPQTVNPIQNGESVWIRTEEKDGEVTITKVHANRSFEAYPSSGYSISRPGKFVVLKIFEKGTTATFFMTLEELSLLQLKLREEKDFSFSYERRINHKRRGAIITVSFDEAECGIDISGYTKKWRGGKVFSEMELARLIDAIDGIMFDHAKSQRATASSRSR